MAGNEPHTIVASPDGSVEGQVAPVGAFTAVILAGSRNIHDKVASLFGAHFKALVSIDGKPMVLHPLRALMASSSVRRIVIIFDDEDLLYRQCPELEALSKQIDITVVPCRPTICGSVIQALEATDCTWPYLLTTADHALLTAEMVDYFCNNALDQSDLAVGLVERTVIEESHPTTKRTYLSFNDNELSGANLFAFMGEEAMNGIRLWKSIEQERKKPWKLFAAFGLVSFFGFLTKRFSVAEAFERASIRIGAKARAVKLPFAEAAIDVDSPKDYAHVSSILESRATKST